MATLQQRIEKTAKRWANAQGYKGQQGGWIYALITPGRWRSIGCQGWAQFADRKRAAIAGAIAGRTLDCDSDVARWFLTGIWEPDGYRYDVIADAPARLGGEILVASFRTHAEAEHHAADRERHCANWGARHFVRTVKES